MKDARLLCDRCGPAPHREGEMLSGRPGLHRGAATFWQCRRCGEWRLEPEPVDCQAIYGKDFTRLSRQR